MTRSKRTNRPTFGLTPASNRGIIFFMGHSKEAKSVNIWLSCKTLDELDEAKKLLIVEWALVGSTALGSRVPSMRSVVEHAVRLGMPHLLSMLKGSGVSGVGTGTPDSPWVTETLRDGWYRTLGGSLLRVEEVASGLADAPVASGLADVPVEAELRAAFDALPETSDG
jgi:hypothetical protein